ncbi:MAG: acylphosphatase [Leptospiraceae bacterium]|nr:acylphosphatase [Leptospiraceae bacterium]
MRRRYVVSGRVQGVGFRQFTAEQARRIGVAGWVRNLADGSVEAEAEGDEDILAQFEAVLRRGPALARVDALKEFAASGNDPLPRPFAVSR